jgi:hypothetical protein
MLISIRHYGLPLELTGDFRVVIWGAINCWVLI